MNRETLHTVKQHLLANREHYAKQYLRPAKTTSQGQDTYICPFCGHGENGDGLKFNTDLFMTCFNGDCNGGKYDLIHYIGQELKLNFSETIKKLSYDLGISNEKPKSKDNMTKDPQIDNAIIGIQDPGNMLKVKEYFKTRNIGEDTITKLVSKGKLGYSIYPGYNKEYMYFIINPKEAHCRAFDKSMLHYPKQENKSIKTNTVWLHENLKTNDKYIFICEGEIDCITLLDKGFNALSIGSSSNPAGLLNHIPKENFNKNLIIVFDNDTAGKGARENLEKAIKEKLPNLQYVQYYLDEFYTDINDFAMAVSQEDFMGWCDYAIENFDSLKSLEITEKFKDISLKEPNVLSHLIDEMFKTNEGVHLVRNEFKHLDKVINGFKDGLTLIGGMPGSGKTSFTCQLMLDFLSQSQNIVMIISLEMSGGELLPRLLSNTSFKSYISGDIQETSCLVRADKFVLNDDNKNYIGETTKKLADKFISKIANNLYLVDGLNFDFEKIQKVIKDFSLIEPNKKHIVMLDYLQFVKPPKGITFSSMREEVGYITDELNTIAKQNKIPLFLISSLNRESYNRYPEVKDFKECGTVEFTAMHAIILTNGKYVGNKENGVFYDISGQISLKKLKDRQSKKNNIDIPVLTGDDVYNVGYTISQWWIVKNRTGESKKHQNIAFYGAFNYLDEIFAEDEIFSAIDEEIEHQKKEQLEIKSKKKTKDETVKKDETPKTKNDKNQLNELIRNIDK